MPTKQNCGRCGPEWSICYMKHLSGTDYEFQFDAERVTTLVWSVTNGCTTYKAGTISPASNTHTISLSGVPDGTYFLKAECPDCRGFCFPFEFKVTHNNGGQIEDPLATPTLSATGINSNTIRVDWTHAGGADDFGLQYSIDGESWDNVDGGTFAANLRTANTSPWATDTLFYFRIRARKGTQYSDWSNEVSAVAASVSTPTHSRKVLLHNAVEWDFGNLTANDSKVAKAVAGGVTHVTLLINWWEIETAQDVYTYTRLDNAINYFAGKGLKSLIQIPYRFAYSGMLGGSQYAYIDTGAAILFRSGNRALSSVEGAGGCKANPFYAERQLKLVARICDHINNNATLKANAQQVLFIDGGSNETGFFTGDYNGNIDDGDFNTATNNDFKVWLQNKYGTIGALNTAWGSGFVAFHAVTKGDYQPTLYSYYIGYSENQRTKDWFEYLCVSHKLFYRRVIQAVRNPQSVDPTLSSTTTGIQVAAYLTEGLTGQGIFWGSGIVNMLSEFDIIFSSIGAADGAHVGGNHLKAFAHRMSVLRGSLPSKIFGQEMDKDALMANGQRIGPSRLMRTTYAQGAEWAIYVFYDEISEWDEAVYYSINGNTISFLADSQLGVSTYVTGQERTLPTATSTLSFNLGHVLANVANPNNIVSDWLSAVNPDAEGLSSTYVNISMNEII
jgi:hypothetical protein